MRVTFLAPLFASGLAIATAGTTATPTPAAAPLAIHLPDSSAPQAPAHVLVALAEGFGLEPVKREVMDPMIRIERGVRDVVEGATSRIAALCDLASASENVRIPDIRVLRVEPVVNASTSGYGWREDPINNRRKFHSGADIRGDYGTPVAAAGDGVVVFAGDKGGYGNVVFVDHGGGVVTRYAHLRKIETKLDATVTAGQRIGQIGATGRTTGPHLHFEVRLDDRPVDPVTALAVADLWRTDAARGRIAAYSLAPNAQAKQQSVSDKDKPKSKASRPERSGHVKRVKPLS
jgi:murein DD-endopeptidase MepM/ murein hydrolase activator NlpD